ncbi:hypothetical protein VNO80_02149 [Phaseolus coccineus]|uniref:Uncharacterized protein n=1 Tax=Phaseolus coccineus TaxID=3886 RepID=A0AAN9NUH9_PHACN
MPLTPPYASFCRKLSIVAISTLSRGDGFWSFCNVLLFKSHLIPNISAQPPTTIASAGSTSISAVTPSRIKSQSLYFTILSLQQHLLLAFSRFFPVSRFCPRRCFFSH